MFQLEGSLVGVKAVFLQLIAPHVCQALYTRLPANYTTLRMNILSVNYLGLSINCDSASFNCNNKCCGSVSFWSGKSGSGSDLKLKKIPTFFFNQKYDTQKSKLCILLQQKSNLYLKISYIFMRISALVTERVVIFHNFPNGWYITNLAKP